MPKQQRTMEEGWIDCRPGAIHEVIASVRKRRWLSRAIGGGATISICLLFLASAAWSLRSASSIDVNACDTIANLLPQYAEGLLARDEMELVKMHLENCEYCRGRLASMETANVTQLQPGLDLSQTDSMLAFTSPSN